MNKLKHLQVVDSYHDGNMFVFHIRNTKTGKLETVFVGEEELY